MLLAACYRETTSADNCPLLMSPSSVSWRLAMYACSRHPLSLCLSLLPRDAAPIWDVESSVAGYGYGHTDPLCTTGWKDLGSSTACGLPAHQRTHCLDHVPVRDSAEQPDTCTEKPCLRIGIVPKCMRPAFKEVLHLFVHCCNYYVPVTLVGQSNEERWFMQSWYSNCKCCQNTYSTAESLL